MANSGKATKAVVKQMVEYIRYFADSVKEDSGKMMDEAQSLNSYWNDTQYQNFLRLIEELTSSLVDKTRALYDCADKVEEHELKRL